MPRPEETERRVSLGHADAAAQEMHHARADLVVVVRLQRPEHAVLASGRCASGMTVAAKDVVIEERLPRQPFRNGRSAIVIMLRSSPMEGASGPALKASHQ